MRSLVFLFLLPFTAMAQISPTMLTTLSGEVAETSGLLLIDGAWWTHNDGGNAPLLYRIDPANGGVLRTVEVTNVSNIDWEDIAADDEYVYIGDVGNNSGVRTDLRILRLPLALLQDENVTGVEADVIEYAYEDQTEFQPANNANNWDCEAIMVKDDSLFLFTKNWLDQQTRVYAVPATPGQHQALLRDEYDVEGMITGAAYHEGTGQVMLVGYTNGLFVPFLVRLGGFNGNDLFGGSVVRESFTLSFVQVEAVEWHSDGEIFMSNESSPFSQPRLWSLNVPGTTSVGEDERSGMHVHPNPAADELWVEGPVEQVVMVDALGKEVRSAVIGSDGRMDVHHLPPGIYGLRMLTDQGIRAVQVVIDR